MTQEELRERIISRYDLDEFCDVLEISFEEVLDMFMDRVYNNLKALEITFDEDEEGEPYSKRSENT